MCTQKVMNNLAYFDKEYFSPAYAIPACMMRWGVSNHGALGATPNF